MKYCESCNSQRVKKQRLQGELEYWRCLDCFHCEKLSTVERIVDFENAQAQYFGDSSILHKTAADVFEHEILKQRKSIVSRFLPPHGLAIEVGPGSGFFAEWLIARGHELLLIEHSTTLAKVLSQRLNVRVVNTQLETCDFLANSQAFFSFHVIEHVADPLAHMKAAFNSARLGSYAFVATPNARSWQQRLFTSLSPNFDSAHLRVFSEESLRKTCEDAGWTVIQISTPEFTNGWLRVATKILRRLRKEDEVSTAGKYAVANSFPRKTVFLILQFVSSPFRRLQSLLLGGNELFFVLARTR